MAFHLNGSRKLKTIKIIIDKKEIEIKRRAEDIDLLLKIISVFNAQ